MKREQFVRLLRREARKAFLEFRIEKSQGKGGHDHIHIGNRFSTVQSGDSTPIMTATIRKQLSL